MQRVDIVRARGDTYSEVVTVTANGQAVDITGWTILCTVTTKPEPTDTGDYLFQVDCVLADALNGVFEIPINATRADNVGVYWFDIQYTYGAIKRTIAMGQWLFVQDRTKE